MAYRLNYIDSIPVNPVLKQSMAFPVFLRFILMPLSR